MARVALRDEGGDASGDDHVFRRVALKLPAAGAAPSHAGSPEFLVQFVAVEILVEGAHPVALDRRTGAKPGGWSHGTVAILGLRQGGGTRGGCGAAGGTQVGDDQRGGLADASEEELDGGNAGRVEREGGRSAL